MSVIPPDPVRLKAIADALDIYLQRGQLSEIRAFGANRLPITLGFKGDIYDNTQAMAKRCLELEKAGASAIYFVPNPLLRDVLEYATNPPKDDKGEERTAAGDVDVFMRTWFLLDADPKRPADTSATDAEKQRAWEVIDSIRLFLEGEGMRGEIITDSGNGYHLDYPVYFANDDEALELFRVLLVKFQEIFGDEITDADKKLIKEKQPLPTPKVVIDKVVRNAARVWKVPGVMTGKGKPSADRPHRMSKLMAGEMPTAEMRQNNVDVLRRLTTQWTEQPAKKPSSLAVVATSGADKVKRASAYLAKVDPAVSGDYGHDQAYHAAMLLAEGFDLKYADAEKVFGEFNKRCVPEWSAAEIRHKLKDAYANRDPERIGRMLADGINATRPQAAAPAGAAPAVAAPADKYVFAPVDAVALKARAKPPQWLIKRVLVAMLPTILGGPRKSLKTTILVAIAVALGMGLPFLGHFAVPQRRRVVLVSGESGEWVILETLERICAAYGISLEDTLQYLKLDFRLPQLANVSDLAELQRGLKDDGFEVCIIDPLYLCLLAGVASDGPQASNLFQMGPLYRNVSEKCLSVGCTPILAHHFRTTRADHTAQPDLGDLSFAGIQEFAGQWGLLGRREAFQSGSGLHRLWFVAGGRPGHSGVWGVDVDEGQLGDEFTGRKWDVKVLSEAEAIANRTDQKAQKRTERETAQQRSDDGAFLARLDELDPHCKGVSRRKLRDALGWGAPKLSRTVERLIGENRIEVCSMKLSAGNGAKQDCECVRRRQLSSSEDTGNTGTLVRTSVLYQ